jgi:hypothetical protein
MGTDKAIHTIGLAACERQEYRLQPLHKGNRNRPCCNVGIRLITHIESRAEECFVPMTQRGAGVSIEDRSTHAGTRCRDPRSQTRDPTASRGRLGHLRLFPTQRREEERRPIFKWALVQEWVFPSSVLVAKSFVLPPRSSTETNHFLSGGRFRRQSAQFLLRRRRG